MINCAHKTTCVHVLLTISSYTITDEEYRLTTVTYASCQKANKLSLHVVVAHLSLDPLSTCTLPVILERAKEGIFSCPATMYEGTYRRLSCLFPITASMFGSGLTFTFTWTRSCVMSTDTTLCEQKKDVH